MSLPVSETSALTSPEGDLRPLLPVASVSEAASPRSCRPDHATMVAYVAGATSAELRAERRGGIDGLGGPEDPELGDFAHFRGLRSNRSR